MGISERDKMLRGELYLATDPVLTAARTRARRLWQRYNAADPDDTGGRDAILAELLGRVGAGAWVEPPFYCDYGAQIELGAGVVVCPGVAIGEVTIVGAGSVVRDLPAGVVAAGIPCRIIRAL